MASAVQDAIVSYLRENPNADNVEVANHVRRAVPGASTTPASVASVKSRLKQEARMEGGGGDMAPMPSWTLPEVPPEELETDEQAAQRILIRYRALERNARRLVRGGVPALIVSGPPGLGKSFEFRKQLKASTRIFWMDVEDQSTAAQEPQAYAAVKSEGAKDGEACDGFYDVISGSITAVGLYQALWNMRKGGVLMLDDVDDVFRDETCLNLLKAALDSDPDHRHISWRKEARWLEEYGIPKTFLFEGHVVFLTNIDFEGVIAKGHRDAEHFKALIDRSLYLCLTLRSQRDFMIRIRQVVDGPDGMLAKVHGLDEQEREELMTFIDENRHRFYNLSLRLVGQCANAMVSDPEGWREDIEATKMRTT